MVEYIVVKSQFGFGGNVYRRGEIVELSDKDALLFLKESVVIAKTKNQLPTESDGLFGELQITVANLEKQVEQQKTMIANFTKEIELKNAKIAELTATKKK
jgi:hypothetical protein